MIWIISYWAKRKQFLSCAPTAILPCQTRTESLFTEEDGWIEIGHSGPEETGFPRNHNPGILTDTKGYMLNDDELVMYFTPAMTGENWLWSYDLYSATFNLKNYFK